MQDGGGVLDVFLNGFLKQALEAKVKILHEVRQEDRRLAFSIQLVRISGNACLRVPSSVW